MTHPDLVLLRAYPNAALAQIAVDALAAHDVPARVEGANRVGALGVEAVSVRVLVAREDEARAREVLDGVEAPPSTSAGVHDGLHDEPREGERAGRRESHAEPWRPSRVVIVTIASLLLAVALGVALLAKTRELDLLLAHNRYGPQRVEGSCSVAPWAGTATPALAQCDEDGDGRAELVRQYTRSGALLGEWVDLDGDGLPEVARAFDAAGALVATARDFDGDGRMERAHSYDRGGRLVATDDDFDGDGRPDVRVEAHVSGARTTWSDLDDDDVFERMEVRDARGALVQELVRDGDRWRVHEAAGE